METRGIVLAGGSGTRLYPNTQSVTKQLLPVYDKPIIYYPISVLMLCGVKEILIISTPRDLPAIEELLGDGSRFGVQFNYIIQKEPAGIPQAFTLGADFIGEKNVALILGDNLFHGNFDVFRAAFNEQAQVKSSSKARVFAYKVADPERYGVIEFTDSTMKEIKSIEEKPKMPKSSYVIPGLYLFDKNVVEVAQNQKPSARGELEITDTIKAYLNEGELAVTITPRGMAWLDTGTPDAILEASSYINAIEKRQGLKVACLEEIALRMNYITIDEFAKLIETTPNCDYKEYLKMILKEFN